jgi:hypothetical protein
VFPARTPTLRDMAHRSSRVTKTLWSLGRVISTPPIAPVGGNSQSAPFLARPTSLDPFWISLHAKGLHESGHGAARKKVPDVRGLCRLEPDVGDRNSLSLLTDDRPKIRSGQVRWAKVQVRVFAGVVSRHRSSLHLARTRAPHAPRGRRSRARRMDQPTTSPRARWQVDRRVARRRDRRRSCSGSPH